MSLTTPARFDCPYCMAYNDLDIDESCDIGQQQIVDCQVCCQPIELMVYSDGEHLSIVAKRDDE